MKDCVNCRHFVKFVPEYSSQYLIRYSIECSLNPEWETICISVEKEYLPNTIKLDTGTKSFPNYTQYKFDLSKTNHWCSHFMEKI